MPAPVPLPENAGLAFPGELAWPPSLLTTREAERLLAAPNPCGRPNTDVLRRRLALLDGVPTETWLIDFPEHFTDQEAALYEQPFAVLRHRAADWRNPRAALPLRRALARVSRWLATPADAEAPDWHWIEDDLLPDASLVVVTRDDDFTRGVLESSTFSAWHGAHRPAADLVRIVESFPFPWPPGTPLGALSREQEAHRHAIARAARSGDGPANDEAVAAAYGWSRDDDEEFLMAQLSALAQRRGAERPR